jgi:hypothetical protein
MLLHGRPPMGVFNDHIEKIFAERIAVGTHSGCKSEVARHPGAGAGALAEPATMVNLSIEGLPRRGSARGGGKRKSSVHAAAGFGMRSIKVWDLYRSVGAPCSPKSPGMVPHMATDGGRTKPAVRYRLDDEQRERIQDCLTKAHISLPRVAFLQLSQDIEASIEHFYQAPVEPTFRETHDRLRALWKLSHLDEPPIRVLREELKELPNRALESIVRRARIVIPRRFPGETIEEDVFDTPDRLTTRFLAWADSASDEKLGQALRILAGRARAWCRAEAGAAPSARARVWSQ